MSWKLLCIVTMIGILRACPYLAFSSQTSSQERYFLNHPCSQKDWLVEWRSRNCQTGERLSWSQMARLWTRLSWCTYMACSLCTGQRDLSYWCAHRLLSPRGLSFYLSLRSSFVSVSHFASLRQGSLTSTFIFSVSAGARRHLGIIVRICINKSWSKEQAPTSQSV